MSKPVQQQVRHFYDEVGWQKEGEQYQNARYEDLRPVSAPYIHRCHLRVGRKLKPNGRFLLDAGSGPIQYPEYLTYSQGYRYRVCLDLSMVALKEARQRIGAHGLFVVADVAHLPFRQDAFEGVVSLHTLHHLPVEEQPSAYRELYRVLSPQCSAVVVNGWTDSPLMRRLLPLVRVMERLGGLFKKKQAVAAPLAAGTTDTASTNTSTGAATGTFVQKLTPDWLRQQLGREMRLEIGVWRSVSVRFLRAVIHPWLLGRVWLRLLYALEERWPAFFGEKGQYPLIVIHKD
ncbi:MAG: class I SAM-dependent methyltransferase [Longilinea sp.]|nr:class I SAM-dependent methyltransferase [Longilinea sp.]MCA1954620.1 class I SAM-dependent methyltransferase [Anaerolinea sp.]